MTPWMNPWLAATALLGLALATPAQAEGQSLDELMRAALVDMPITTSPASAMLGASGENVPRLSSFRAFSMQVARGFDAKGQVAEAMGAELAPALAMGDIRWEGIQRSALTRVWSRTTLSFATKVGSSRQGAQAAVGLQSILYAPSMDGALMAAAKDQCQSAAAAMDTVAPAPEPGPPKRLPKDVLASIEACQMGIDAMLTKWNQPMVSVGAGRTFGVASSSSAASPKQSSAIWLTAAWGGDVGPRADPSEFRWGYLVTGHVRASTHVPVTDSIGADALARQRLAGINLRVGNARLAGLGEYSTTQSRATGVEVAQRQRALLGLEYQVDKSLYLTLGVARDSGLDASKQSVLAKLNWGFGRSPTLLIRQ